MSKNATRPQTRSNIYPAAVSFLLFSNLAHSSTVDANTLIGTPYYLSPELCEDRPYNNKVDVWALGVVIFELCALQQPFLAANQGALVLKILRASIPPLPDTYSRALQGVVSLCLRRRSAQRPDVLQLLRAKVLIDKVRKDSHDRLYFPVHSFLLSVP